MAIPKISFYVKIGRNFATEDVFLKIVNTMQIYIVTDEKPQNLNERLEESSQFHYFKK
jgi:hypothetical protein